MASKQITIGKNTAISVSLALTVIGSAYWLFTSVSALNINTETNSEQIKTIQADRTKRIDAQNETNTAILVKLTELQTLMEAVKEEVTKGN